MEKLKCNVVMLPTTEKAINNSIIKYFEGPFATGELRVFDKNKIHNINHSAEVRWQPQCLFFVSDREIKINDYWYDFLDKEVRKAIIVTSHYVSDGHSSIYFGTDKTKTQTFKIEAASDSSLCLPLISQSFIEKYVEKQGEINEVMIEMETYYTSYLLPSEECRSTRLKLRRNNTVIVSKVKNFIQFPSKSEIEIARNNVKNENWIRHPSHFFDSQNLEQQEQIMKAILYGFDLGIKFFKTIQDLSNE